MPLDHGPQQRERDGVVPADGHQPRSRAEQLIGACLYGGDRLVDVERVAGDVAGVGNLLGGER
jgi:hypothetical protein